MGVRVSTSNASSFSIISLGTAGEEYSWARRVTVPGRPASFATSMP